MREDARQLARTLEIHSGIGRLRLAGKWQLARETHTSADLGSIALDLTQAEFDDHVTRKLGQHHDPSTNPILATKG